MQQPDIMHCFDPVFDKEALLVVDMTEFSVTNENVLWKAQLIKQLHSFL